MIDLEIRAALLESLADLNPGDCVGVGVSGGADSVALLRGAVHVGNELGLVIHAIVIDHQLQDDSAATAHLAQSLCHDLNAHRVEVITVKVRTGPGSGGMEAAARDARRSAFDDYVQAHNLVAILLGHTLEDQAETVLLGLARGSGARSLSGMRKVDSIYRRPLLSLQRQHVRLTVADLVTVEDAHNFDEKYARVRVRQHVIPNLEHNLGPGVSAALARTADMLREDADALDSIAQVNLTHEIEKLKVLSSAVRTRVLRQLAIAAGCTANDLSREHVLMIDGLIMRWHGQGPINLPGAVNCQRVDGRLVFTLNKSH